MSFHLAARGTCVPRMEPMARSHCPLSPSSSCTSQTPPGQVRPPSLQKIVLSVVLARGLQGDSGSSLSSPVASEGHHPPCHYSRLQCRPPSPQGVLIPYPENRWGHCEVTLELLWSYRWHLKTRCQFFLLDFTSVFSLGGLWFFQALRGHETRPVP